MMTEDTLQAYVDGALSPEDAAKVVLYLIDHPQEQARVDAMMALNETLAQAYDAPIHEPVPQAIYDTIMQSETNPAPVGVGATVVPFRRRATRWMGAGVALAASLALAAVILPDFMTPANMHLTVGPLANNTTLDNALDNHISGTQIELENGAILTAVASFATVSHGFCREVELLPPTRDELESAIACQHNSGTWHIEIATAVPGTAQETGFVPASGEGPDMINTFLDAIGASFALSIEEEEKAITKHWITP